MKKILLALAVAASAQFSAFAQGYTFSQSTGTYADLTGSTVVSTPGWEFSTASFVIPIGFTFVVDGEAFTSVEADGWGDLYFSNASADKAIFAFDAVLLDKSYPSTSSTLSPVSYLLSGTAGSRILKIEYKNVGIVTPPAQQGGQATVNPADVANFQIWLYEGSNKIETHYGASSVADIQGVFFGEDGPTVAIVTESTSSNISGLFLSGAASAPTLTTLTQATSYPGIDGLPATGTIYAFQIVNNTGIVKAFDKANVSVFPNPVVNTLNIKGLSTKGNVSIKVTDVLGKVVLTENVAAAQNVSVNVNNLKKGVYSVEITSEEGRSIKQIVKQ